MDDRRGRRLAAHPRPRRFCRRAAATAAVALLSLTFADTAGAAGAADAALATFRGGAVTRGGFEGFQKWKIGEEEYRGLLKDPAALRAAVLRLAMLEVVAGLAGQAGVGASAEFTARVHGRENEQLAALWRKKITDEVTLTDGELDRMVPEQESDVLVHWASFPDEAEAGRFADALRAGTDPAAAAAQAGVGAPAWGEARLSAGAETHFSGGSKARILALGAGEVAGPLQEPIGWYVVKAVARTGVEEKRRAQREQLRPEVLKSKRETALAQAAAGLREKAAVTIDEQALANPAQAAGRPVALVNGEAVVFEQEAQHGRTQHGEAEKILRKRLDKKIDELLAAQEARRLGLERAEPQWRERLGYFSLELLAGLYRDRVFEGFTVGEEEVREYWAANPEIFKTVALVRVRQIVLQSRYLAERYRDDLIAGRAVFEELARRESLDRGSAAAGGDQGWLREDSIREELRPYVEALRPGEISVPVPVGGNYYLLKLEARTEREVIPFEQCREQARTRALLAKRTRSYQEFVERKQREAQVRLDEAAIDALANP